MLTSREARRLEQKEMCAFLESDLYRREPLPEMHGGMLWESPGKWKVFFDIPSGRYPDDPYYNDRQEIDLWIIEPDGQLYQYLPNTITQELAEVLP